MKKKLCPLLCCALLLSACGTSQKSVSASPVSGLSAVPAEEVSMQEQSWKPYYTGESRDWAQEKPWSEANDAPVDNQDEGLDAYFDLYPGVLGQEDYGGCYINASGALTVMVVNPTEERAKEYAEKTETGFWIIAADYTYQELKEAQEQYMDKIDQWITAHPKAYLKFNSCGIDEVENRVMISLSGPPFPL